VTSTEERPGRGDAAVSWTLHGLVVGAAAGAVAIDRRLRRRGSVRGQLAVPIVASAFYAVIWVAERRRPYRDGWRPGADEVATDAAFLATGAVALAIGGAVEPAVGRVVRTAGVDRLPVALGAAVGVLAFDLGHSRLHHLGHRWGPAWRIHSVHHSPERLYWFNATRFHVVELLADGVIEGLAIGLLGMSRDQHVAYQAIRATYGQLQHSNVALRSGPLDHVFSTPDLHRWHHSTVYDEGDTNYGAITSVWDAAFGTRFRPIDRAGPEAVGVGRMPDFPQRFWALERVPFDWTAIRERNAATWFDGEDAAVGR
jgi:sterol desaturase/sphingolipid hydroxylase (fatty acid hydroxylase superfamily)